MYCMYETGRNCNKLQYVARRNPGGGCKSAPSLPSERVPTQVAAFLPRGAQSVVRWGNSLVEESYRTRAMPHRPAWDYSGVTGPPSPPPRKKPQRVSPPHCLFQLILIAVESALGQNAAAEQFLFLENHVCVCACGHARGTITEPSVDECPSTLSCSGMARRQGRQGPHAQ